jgi:hypothetical protein
VLPDLQIELFRTAARRYLDHIAALAPPGARRVVDKMPDNFRQLGLIAVLWPSARVIVCRRDLRDVALSCWQTGFERNPWTNDWCMIARRFADYQRMMDHWRQTQPIEWLEIRYESLVGDLESHARRLIDFVGLDWNPACLDFHKTKRVVRTASHIQVRRPLYTHSVGRWRNYAASLEPLLHLLDKYQVRLTDHS